jgi:hypothetical protein
VLENPGHTNITVRVSADGGISAVRGTVGAGQARPPFLTEMHRTLRLSFDGSDVDPRWLGDPDIDDFVRDVLLSETRVYPVAVISPTEEGEYVIAPAEVADELAGLAHVYAVDRHPATFRLTDALGDRRLSCYWGALRVYLPDFSCADRPEDHPLLMADRLVDPVIRADLVGKLALFTRQFIHTTNGRGHGTPSVASDISDIQRAHPHVVLSGLPETVARNDSAEPAVAAVTPTIAAPTLVSEPPSMAVSIGGLPPDVLQALGSMPLALDALTAQVAALADTIGQLAIANSTLRDEVERLRTTNAVRAASTTSLERRLRSFEGLLQQQLSANDSRPSTTPEAVAEQERMEAEEEAKERTSLLDVLRQGAVAHSDALLVLDSAERSAIDSPYEDTDRVAVILDAMAGVARRRQEGALGVSLKDAFRELGIDYRGGISPATSNKQLQQYAVRGPGGVAYDCREHIVLGTSYDPRFCLRIYFTSRAPLESRFVIGHVGRHLDVATTS